MDRPILLGMNSPQSEDPDKALWPWNWACAGGRLLKMIQEEAARRGIEYFPPEWYVRGFDRINVLDRKEWDPALARAAAPLVHERVAGRTVVVCGRQVQRVMDYQRLPWLQWNPPMDEVRYCLIPHPSGLTHYYNDPVNRAAVGGRLLDLYVAWISSQAAGAQASE